MRKEDSIETLENEFWGDTPEDASGLVRSCYEIRKKELNELDENDLRIALGQNIGLPYVIPLAINKLSNDPLVEALYYEGDLLKALINTSVNFWKSNTEAKLTVQRLVREAKERIKEIDIEDDLRDELIETFDKFLSL